jgi:hypothetical protein
MNNKKYPTEVSHQTSLLNWRRMQCSGVDENVATVTVSGAGGMAANLFLIGRDPYCSGIWHCVTLFKQYYCYP